MYQPSTNFWGKDPMNWWIGQVTDPEKGKWGDSLESTQAANGEDIYAFRCRVRIIGYHDCADDLPDEDLPLAHILLPPNTATTGGCGETLQYQGGEVVVGFFFDGEDAQQPVIFGTLFKQTFIPDDLTTAQFNAKKQTCFTPYTPPKVVQEAGKQQVFQESPWPRAFTPGELFKTVTQNQKEEATTITIDNTTACQDNEISKISNTIKDFVKKMEALQDIGGGLSTNPIYGGVVDSKSEIQIATNKIHNSMTQLIRRGRSWVIQETLDKLNLKLKDETDKTLQAGVGQATKDLTDVIFCNFEKIQDELLDYLSKSLENMIGQVLDVPICGVENFMSDMFGQINNILDSQLGTMFGQLNNIQGGAIGLPSDIFSKAIKFANIITNVLDCDRQNCPENTTYSSRNGLSKSLEDDFGNILDKIGLKSVLDDFVEGVDGMIEADPSAPDCSTNVLKCGPPKVDFIGGGGTGASGSAIVNALGKIIGVAINGVGSGYTEPPLLSLVDGCDKGYGAGGIVRVKNGGIQDVVITNSGQGFLSNTTETDLDGNVKEITPDPNANYDGAVSYVATLDDVIVQNTGVGYQPDDTITIEGAEVELNINDDGLIVGANVVNGGFGFTDIPDVTINTDTGALARLLPVLKFTKVDDAAQLAEITQDAVVTVISCIEK